MIKRVSKKKWFKKSLWVLVGVALIAVLTITRMDYTPLNETEYYLKSKETIESLKIPKLDTTQVKAGWAKVNITPDFPFKVVGFGKNSLADGVLDSTYVRAIVFKQNNLSVVYLSYDLMIVHPLVAEAVEKKIKREIPSIDHIYFTATHTHNGIGGYADKLSGYFALGGYDQRIVDLLIDKTVFATLKASDTQEPVSYCYASGNYPDLLRNRINRHNGEVDGELTALILEKERGEKAIVVTFAAHPTLLGRKYRYLSGDYPSVFCDSLEASKIADFAIFSAGSVGSHEPKQLPLEPASCRIFAQDLSWAIVDVLQNKKEFLPLRKLSYLDIDLPLREPHFKVGYGFRLRPWVFNTVFGEANPKLTFLRLGDVLHVGTPCDFSGELALDIKRETATCGLTPVITSFNGSYVGYITPDKYYEWDTHEVRDVNWFGPYNGQYFSETITNMIFKIHNSQKE